LSSSVMQWVRGALSMGIKRPEREADHSPLPICKFFIRV